MRQHFTIWIVSPAGLVWSHVFDEVAIGLQSAFRALGYEVAVVRDPREISGVAVVLGANLAAMHGIAVPEDAIIYNLEQVHPDSRWFAEANGYVALLKTRAVWDFSLRNIVALKELGVEPVVHCPVGYAPEMSCIAPAEQDVDVLFIGGGHPRRTKVLDDIHARGAGLKVLHKVFGAERDAWIARGKVHLNVHKEEAEIFEVVRVSYLLANRCFVVSELGRDMALEQNYAAGVAFGPYKRLADMCLDYLGKPAERKMIAEAGFELFRGMSQKTYLERALAEYEAQQRKRMPAALPGDTIFVAVASYRDSEIMPTLTDLLQKAAKPGRVRVGVCLQRADEDAGCDVDESAFGGQVKVVRMPHTQSKGANWARVQALALMQGEAYVLMIDSHMRFTEGWDEALVAMLDRCPAKKPVITAYLPNYDPPDKKFHHPGQFLRTRIKGLGKPVDAQQVHISGELVDEADRERAGLYPTPVAVANFIFARASMLEDVPVDPAIYFWGDEITYAARLWTHGYDIFQADRLLGWHYWVRKDTFHLQPYREPKAQDNRASAARVLHVLGVAQGEDLPPLGQYGLGSERKLEDLWAFAGIDWSKRSVNALSERGIWNMTARDEGRGMGSTQGGLPRIFVQIASYRDPQCQWTVKDLFEKAAHPERITVGICWQFSKPEDDICFSEPYPYPQQVRVHGVDAKESKGVCWARGLTQQLWRGEEYTLQIDSHMRFEPGWDNTLLGMLAECEDPKAVLTCYAPGFTPPDKLEKGWIFGMSAKEFDKYDIFLMKGAPGYRVPNELPAHPMPGAFVSANMLFGPSSIIQDVPYDPNIYFFGEEITMAVRLWTHGYNLYHPNRLVIYHDWKRDKRPTHFADHRDWTKQNDKAYARVKHLLGTAVCEDAEILKDLDKYGLGMARTLEQYQEYSGVDFARKVFSQKAEKGHYERYGAPARRSIRLGEGESKAMGMQQAGARGDGRIFVNIASYRDPECQWTVKDLFEKAAKPDRISVGICWQFDPEEDKHCFEVTTRPMQVRISPTDWREAEGVCWARSQAQALWEGEEYTLMIDSHMRFMPGWDLLLIEELAKCDSAKPVLSSSPARYTPPNELSTRLNPTIRRAKHFQPDGNIRCQGEGLDRAPERPLPAAFLVANCIFSRSEITPEVPYDPYLYFDQEEISYAARLYTHGWDIFSPTRQFMYHYYNDTAAPGGSVRPLHWRDLHKEDSARIKYLRERGLKRFNHMTGFEATRDEGALADLGRYGFGRVRTLAQYEAFSGVDFKHKITTDRALYCQFIENLSAYRDRPILIPEAEKKQARPAMPQGRPAVQAQGGAGLAVAQAPQFMPVQQPLLRPQVAASLLLETGDFMPLFELHDTDKRLRTMEALAGRFGLLLYLPSAKPEAAAAFLQEVKAQLEQAGISDTFMVLATDDAMERANAFREKFGVAQHVWLDPERRLARSLGIVRGGEAMPFAGFVLDTNMKILNVQVQGEAGTMAQALVQQLGLGLAQFGQRNAQPQTVRRMAPALIVPQVFTPEFCAKCIQAFRNGNSFEGTVGTRENKVYREDIKVRRDFIPGGELLEEIDDKFSRSFFPEIKKVFGFEVTHREIYKIGLYSGEKGGFFKQHRDNFDYPMGYRRIASTIHLNDDYEGGGVRFPEYGHDVYRPETGGAIAFSGSTLHEALPVTKGERFVLVAFVHGDEEEAYRRHFLASRHEPLNKENYMPKLRKYPELRQGRWFYKDWLEKNARYDASAVLGQPPASLPAAANVNQQQEFKPTLVAPAPHIMIGSGQHQPKKMFESPAGIVFDDFLPQDVYNRIYNWALTTEYERINTHGKTTRAWHLQDGFPLRSSNNFFYHAKRKDEQKPEHIYPMKNDIDAFMEAILAIGPQVAHLVGKPDEQWAHFSVTGWLYPHGTGLAMHDDGSGVYTGAYTFFLNPTWRAHWGGLLLLMDEEANQTVQAYRRKNDQYEFYKKKWLHANQLDELLLEQGMGKCIFPKGNRIVFIANEGYHMITRVNEQSGDMVRMSLAGFFNRKK